MHQKVINFIDRFTDRGKRHEVIDTFSNGCCYWFATILYERFIDYCHCYVVYDQVANHWGTKIDGRVYDITGDVSDNYNWRDWFVVVSEDEALAARLARDCIDF